MLLVMTRSRPDRVGAGVFRLPFPIWIAARSLRVVPLPELALELHIHIALTARTLGWHLRHIEHARTSLGRTVRARRQVGAPLLDGSCHSLSTQKQRNGLLQEGPFLIPKTQLQDDTFFLYTVTFLLHANT